MIPRSLIRWNAVTIATILLLIVLALATNVGGLSFFRGSIFQSAAAVILLVVGHFCLVKERFALGSVLLIIGGLVGYPFGLISVCVGYRVFRLMVADHRKKQPSSKCLKCGYDLTGLTKPRCPECGCLFGFTKSIDELGISESEIRES